MANDGSVYAASAATEVKSTPESANMSPAPGQARSNSSASGAMPIQPTNLGGGSGTPTTAAGGDESLTIVNQGYSIPPPSQPMLEGGSGFRGTAMEMTSIQEEREQSA